MKLDTRVDLNTILILGAIGIEIFLAWKLLKLNQANFALDQRSFAAATGQPAGNNSLPAPAGAPLGAAPTRTGLPPNLRGVT